MTAQAANPLSYPPLSSAGDRGPKPSVGLGAPDQGTSVGIKSPRILVRGAFSFNVIFSLFFVRLIDLTGLFKPSEQNQHSPP